MVSSMNSAGVCQLADVLILVECISCIKTLVNSKRELQFLTSDTKYTRKLMSSKMTCEMAVCAILVLQVSEPLLAINLSGKI